ncbi:MAG TPA: mechanosensitive ion channel [Candidatus Stackebrandtia faecavium]|nr:mechanosensitive ion channel [Candidatus Stackebrandtia faecavium]
MKEIAPLFLLPAAGIIAVLVTIVSNWFLRRVLRRSRTALAIIRETYRPTQVLLTLLVVRIALGVTDDFTWRGTIAHMLLIGMIAALGWLATQLLYLMRLGIERQFNTRDNGGDKPQLRQRRTQIMVMYRTGFTLIWLITIGCVFMTFPGARAIGTSLLASAGVAGVIVGLAAQTMLKNLFAGLSLAFGDTIRLGDIVEIEGEWGKVEDVRLSYVVVLIWDERRLVLPTSYFTDNAYRNWSRGGQSVLGVVELEVDWRLPMEELRAEFDRLVVDNPLWDGRAKSLWVTNVNGPMKLVRPLISASDADNQWYLRCEVREKLIDWIVENYPHCIPNLHVRSHTAHEVPASRVPIEG